MKELKAGREVNIGKGLIETGVFLLILNLLVAALLWEAISHHWQILGEGLLTDRAWIRQDQRLVFTGLSWENGYLFLLHGLFGFLGNHQAVVVAANILLQLLGLLFFYRGSRRLTNGVISLITAGILAVVSSYCFSVVLDRPEHLIWCSCGLGIWVLSFIRPLFAGILSRAKAVEDRAKVEPEPMKSEAKPVESIPEPEKSEAKPAESIPEPKKSVSKPVETVSEPTESEEEPVVKLIPNPLPLPRKHVKKEMNYAFEPPKERMHYDLNNYNVNDDYDLKEG